MPHGKHRPEGPSSVPAWNRSRDAQEAISLLGWAQANIAAGHVGIATDNLETLATLLGISSEVRRVVRDARPIPDAVTR